MSQSAAEEASVKSFFINGRLKGEDHPELASAALEDPLGDISAGNQFMPHNEQGVLAAGSLDGIPDVTTEIEGGQPANHAPTSNDMVMDPLTGEPLSARLDAADPFPAQREGPTSEAEVSRATHTAPRGPSPGPDPLSEMDELTSSEDELPDASATVRPTNHEPSAKADEVRRASRREVKPPPIFTSGTTLTVGAPPKKRPRLKERDPTRAGPPAKVKQEDQYWETTQDYWYKAVSDTAFLMLPSVSSHTLSYPQHAEARTLVPDALGTVADANVAPPESPVAPTPVNTRLWIPCTFG